MGLWRRLAEEKIERAMEEGAFDNLPGVGRPLPPPDDSQIEPDMQLAYHLLRTNGFTLPWISERREIEIIIGTARSGLARTWRWLRDGERDAWAEEEWCRAVAAFRLQVARINRRIANYNLITPSWRTQRRLLDADLEIERIVRGGDQ